MICYSLACERGHNFDSWFADSTAYDRQRKRKLVSCPQCGSVKVDKAPMAPRLGRSNKERDAAPAASQQVLPTAPVAMLSPQEKEIRQKLKDLRDHLTRNAEHVGSKFPDQARKMHYGEIEHRSIYGEASPDDAQQLAEEGIEFHPLPILPDEHN